MSQFVTKTDNVNSWVRFTFPSAGLCRLQYDIRTTDTSGGCIVTSLNNVDFWRGAWAIAETAGTRCAHISLNGSSVSGILRNALASAIATGNWVTVFVDLFDRSSVESSTSWPFQISEVIEFAHYSYSSAYCPNADLRNFKVDIGRTGSWTHESTLGNTNGFSRNNVTVTGQSRNNAFMGVAF